MEGSLKSTLNYRRGHRASVLKQGKHAWEGGEVGDTKRPARCWSPQESLQAGAPTLPSSVCSWTENLLGVKLPSASPAVLIMMLFRTAY